MNSINADTIGWYLRKLAKALGLWGGVAFIAITAVSVFYSTKMAEIKQQLVQANEDTERKLTRKTEQDAALPIEATQADHSLKTLRDFYALFPTDVSLPDTLSSIDRIAKKHQLALNAGDYKLSKVKASNPKYSPLLVQYEVALPIIGSYRNIRGFIADVLTQLPSVAIADIQMHRDSTLVPLLEVKLLMVLFVRSESA